MLNFWLNVQGPNVLLLCSGNVCQIALLHVHRLEPGHKKKMTGSSNAEEICSSTVSAFFLYEMINWSFSCFYFEEQHKANAGNASAERLLRRFLFVVHESRWSAHSAFTVHVTTFWTSEMLDVTWSKNTCEICALSLRTLRSSNREGNLRFLWFHWAHLHSCVMMWMIFAALRCSHRHLAAVEMCSLCYITSAQYSLYLFIFHTVNFVTKTICSAVISKIEFLSFIEFCMVLGGVWIWAFGRILGPFVSVFEWLKNCVAWLIASVHTWQGHICYISTWLWKFVGCHFLILSVHMCRSQICVRCEETGSCWFSYLFPLVIIFVHMCLLECFCTNMKLYSQNTLYDVPWKEQLYKWHFKS